MALVGRRLVPFPLEDVTQMPTTVRAYNLGPGHAQGTIGVPRHSAGNAVKVRRPAAARRELVGGFVQRGFAPGAGVDTLVGLVLVPFARARRLGAFFSQDAELF